MLKCRNVDLVYSKQSSVKSIVGRLVPYAVCESIYTSPQVPAFDRATGQRRLGHLHFCFLLLS